MDIGLSSYMRAQHCILLRNSLDIGAVAARRFCLFYSSLCITAYHLVFSVILPIIALLHCYQREFAQCSPIEEDPLDRHRHPMHTLHFSRLSGKTCFYPEI